MKNYTIYREEQRPYKKRIRRLKPSFKKWRYENLLNEMRNAIVNNFGYGGISVEEISFKFRAKHNLVKKAIYQLVRDGILTKRPNRPPHDVARGGEHPPPPKSKRTYFGSTGWRASFWEKRRDR